MKSIPNKPICTWYYAFFIINAIAASFSLLILIMKVAFVKKNVIDVFVDSLSAFLVFVIGTVNALFFYVMCDRTLLGAETKTQ